MKEKNLSKTSKRLILKMINLKRRKYVRSEFKRKK
uniref:Uncharacterized protein n=1 Tax=Myoviridae sp. ctkfK18 TaxID=2825165 RepID=A0A8S5VH82_9CAUD|nr:MAG TPA: hypothetical protein [Myoviridae sp. ctkfK18]